MEKWALYAAIWLGFFSLISVIVCVYDKKISKKKDKRRVAEAWLWFLSFLGAAAAMYGCMIIIRHKTKHRKFMVGLPILFLIQAALLGCGAIWIFKMK